MLIHGRGSYINDIKQKDNFSKLAAHIHVYKLKNLTSMFNEQMIRG